MPVGPFLSHDANFATLLSTDNWVTDDHYAVLATTTETPDRALQLDLADILAECPDTDYARQNLASEAVAVNDTKVRFTCGKITFTASGDVTARYLYILKGTVASSGATDIIIGHIDLSGSGNLSSVNAEFSFTPSATNGLFEISRTAAPA